MKLKSYTSEGIVLARKNYGEADRILSVFTKDHGRVAMIAKGIRRPKSRKRGHLEVFSQIKFQSVAGHGVDLMTEAEVCENFSEVRKSLKKISLAYYLSEVVGRITHEGEPNQELYYLILNYLSKLKTTSELKKLRKKFIGELLTLMGYWPQGYPIPNPDEVLTEVIERQISSVRVGKRMLE